MKSWVTSEQMGVIVREVRRACYGTEVSESRGDASWPVIAAGILVSRGLEELGLGKMPSARLVSCADQILATGWVPGIDLIAFTLEAMGFEGVRLRALPIKIHAVLEGIVMREIGDVCDGRPLLRNLAWIYRVVARYWERLAARALSPDVRDSFLKRRRSAIRMANRLRRLSDVTSQDF